MARPTLLILGGTTEGAMLARTAIARFADRLTVVSSLAGRTELPGEIPGEVRRGGFGGVAGLVDFLTSRNIGMVLDATHPFAATMARHAAEACARTGVPLLAMRRPAWPAVAGERRIMVPDMTAAAATLRDQGARRVLVTTGARELATLAAAPDVWFLIRLIEPLVAPLPLPRHAVIYARGAFTETAERRLMQEHDIDALLTKHSGGGATFGKITAARNLGLPVVMVERPAVTPVAAVADIESALDWIEVRLGDRKTG